MSGAQTLKSRQKFVNQDDTTNIKSDHEESVNYITRRQQLSDQIYYSNYDSDSDGYVEAVSSDTANQLQPLNARTQYGKFLSNSMIDSSSVCSRITKNLANRLPKSTGQIQRDTGQISQNFFERADKSSRNILNYNHLQRLDL